MNLHRHVALSTLSLPIGLLLLLIGTTGTSDAQTASATALTVNAACPQSGCVDTLVATVTAGAEAVHPGLVIFCDGAALNCENEAPIGHSQLLADGTATIRLALSPGRHTLRAIFHGTKTFAKSGSSAQILNVTSAGPSTATATTISATGLPGEYTLQSTVTGSGTLAPTGTVSFLDATNANSLITSAPLGAGQRSFSYVSGLDLSQVSSSVVTSQYAVVAGDFNNDGFEDIAEVETNQTLVVLLGDGKGNFTLASESGITTKGRGPMVVGDFNSDGKLDVAVSDGGAYQIHLYLGTGNGTFTTGPTTTMSDQPGPLTVVDLNNDGIPDLVSLAYTGSFNDGTGGSSLYPLLGLGDGTFKSKPHNIYKPTGATSPTRFSSLVVADFDRDGVPDAAFSGPVVYRGNGDGTFTQLPVQADLSAELYLTAGDFDGDGVPDLVSNGNIFGQYQFFRGNGDGTFAAGVVGDSAPVNLIDDSVVSGDFNGDGVLDIARLANDNSGNPILQILAGNGDGTFSTPGSVSLKNGDTFARSFAIADFNGDGIADVVDFAPLSLKSTKTGKPPTGSIGTATTISTATSPGGVFLPGTGSQNVVASFPGDSFHSASKSTALTLTNSPVNDPTGFQQDPNIEINGAFLLGVGTPDPQGQYPSYAIGLTDGKRTFAVGSFFHRELLPVHAFSSKFDFQLTNAVADGFAFVVQADGPDAYGSPASGLGYGTPAGVEGDLTFRISNSYAVAFDLHSNQGEGSNSIRLEANGITTGTNAVDLTPYGLDLHSGHRFTAEIINSGSDIKVTLLDTAAQKTATIDLGVLPAGAFSGDSAYVGFTGSTGTATATQTIYNWTYTLLQPILPSANEPTFPDGFIGSTGLVLNGGASIAGGAILLADPTKLFQASSVYFPTKLALVNSSFDTDFEFNATDNADGFTFVLQDQGPTALGSYGGGLGYGVDQPGAAGRAVKNSLAIKFDYHSNAGEGTASTGLYVNGASPTTPAIDTDRKGGFHLHTSDVIHAHITHNAASNTLVLTLFDLTTHGLFQTTFPVDNPSLPSSSVYVGFTAGTGQSASSVNILNWTLVTRP